MATFFLERSCEEYKSFPSTGAPEEGTVKTRVLIAFEGEYRAYREIARFDPHLVIYSQPNTANPNGRPAWVELPLGPDQVARICLNGEYSESSNPALEELLRAVDETERLLRTKPDSRNC
jgi:hypothetical protein